MSSYSQLSEPLPPPPAYPASQYTSQQYTAQQYPAQPAYAVPAPPYYAQYPQQMVLFITTMWFYIAGCSATRLCSPTTPCDAGGYEWWQRPFRCS